MPTQEVKRGTHDLVLHRGPNGTLGISVSCRNRGPGPYQILGLAPGGAAEASGLLQQDDLIHAIDYVHIENLPFNQVAAMLRGNPGSRLVLTMSRPDTRSQPSRSVHQSHASLYVSNPSLHQAHQHAQQPSNATSHTPPANHNSQQPSLRGRGESVRPPAHLQRPLVLQPAQTGVMRTPSPPPRRQPAPGHTSQHRSGVSGAPGQYEAVYNTRQVAFSSAQQTLIADFKRKIETSDTRGLMGLHQEILKLADSVYVQAPYASMGLYAKLGFAYNSLPYLEPSQFERAIEVLQTANTIAQKQQDTVTQGALYFQLGLAHTHLKRYDEALEWFGHYIAFARNNQHEDGELEAFLKLADISQRLNNHAQAIDWYSQALEMMQKRNDSARIGRIRQKIGMSHEALSNYKQALLCHRAHYDQAKAVRHESEQVVHDIRLCCNLLT